MAGFLLVARAAHPGRRARPAPSTTALRFTRQSLYPTTLPISAIRPVRNPVSLLQMPTPGEDAAASATDPVPRPANRDLIERHLSALRAFDQRLYAVRDDRGLTLLSDRAPRTMDGLAGIIPAIRPEDLGSAAFRQTHNLRCAYVAGAMAGGIASVDLVVDMARAGLLGFFGAGALPPRAVAEAIHQLRSRLGQGESWGVNLLHDYYDEGPSGPRLSSSWPRE